MLTPPSGTVTFLFTDIEGSTQLSQKHPAEFPQALARHHEILRQAIEAAQGYVFQVVGDSFCAAFTTAREAISAALNAQRSLQREKWQTIREIRVRMGVHTGAAVWQRDKYEGYLTLAHVQRLMSAGHGGQILLSQTTYNLVRDELPADVSTRDMGERRLRDVERTERIYQLAAPDLPAHFPSLRTSETRPNNLPVQTTSFVGREQAFAEVKQLLSATSLLTLTGAGGSGKTRLALEVAADMLDSFAKGVWLVELAPLTDPLLIPHEVADVLSLRVDERQPVLDSLIDYLREKELLIVLDNCEHLIEACAQFATDMLRSCPRVKIMASSREVLGIAGETTYRVPTLNTPDPAHLPSLQALNQYDAVKLFSARASAARPGFKITSRNALAVAQICHQLDGIPLAIELAAARVKALSVEQIAARLDDRFRLLSGGSRATLPRQQTLRALIDWSYDLLLDAERVLLHRLSVFVDGCSLEAAEAVCSDAPTAQRADANSAPALAPADVMDLLIHLVDKSLVISESKANGETRYHLLQTIQQYAHDKLCEAGDDDATRTRHLTYFAELSAHAAPQLRGPDQLQWAERLEVEQDNLRAALDWSLGPGRVASGLALAVNLTPFWELRATFTEGRARLEQLLKQPEAAPRTLLRARALNSASVMTHMLGERTATTRFGEEAIALAREHQKDGWPVLSAAAARLALMLLSVDRERSARLLDESWSIAQQLQHNGLSGDVLQMRAYWHMAQGEIDAARELSEEALRAFRADGDSRRATMIFRDLGRILFLTGDVDGARTHYEQSLKYFREACDQDNVAVNLNMLGEIARLVGADREAIGYYEEALALARDLGAQGFASLLLTNLGFAHLHLGDLDRAQALFTESLQLDQSRTQKEAVIADLEAFASLAAAREQPIRAAQLFGAAEHLKEELGDVRGLYVNPSDEAEYKRNVTLARQQLAERAFNAAWQEGRALSRADAIALALGDASDTAAQTSA